MSANRELLTQGELAALTEELTTLVDNLTEHANAPLDKAHGINLVRAVVDPYGDGHPGYFDSGGDRLTAASPSNYLLRISAGAAHTIYYVPAILAGGTPAPALAGKPALLKSISGTPVLDRALVTEYTQSLEDEAKLLNMLLLEHAKAITSSGAPAAHGQITVSAIDDGPGGKDARDTLGHRLGRSVLKMRIGNRIYRIPCDTRKQGPAQGVRKVADGEPAESAMSAAPAGQGNGPVTATFKVTGECPVRFRWRAGPNENQLTPVFSSNNFDGTFVGGFFSSAVENPAKTHAVKDGNSLHWSFDTPVISNQAADETVSTVSCTITSRPSGTDGGNTYTNDLVLVCDAMAGDDTDFVTSIVVRWSAYDETDGFFDC